MLNTTLSQRLSLEALHAYEALGFGMFIHYSMNTFQGVEHPMEHTPASTFAPKKVDCAQWARVAKEAGMSYAVLTAKHDTGFCLWPSEHTDYHVGNSPWGRDVVQDYVDAFRAEGLKPGIYYCAWDNHHRQGSAMPADVWDDKHFDYDNLWASEAYMEFVWNQCTELCTRYGDWVEFWLDIPVILPQHFRRKLYDHLTSLQPQMLFVSNNGMPPEPGLRLGYAWPTDVYPIEQAVPPLWGHEPVMSAYQQKHYIPMESCDTTGKWWFNVKEDRPKSDEELLGTYLLNRTRGANVLLNVGPHRDGHMEQPFVDALMRLRANLDKLGVQ